MIYTFSSNDHKEVLYPFTKTQTVVVKQVGVKHAGTPT